MDKYIKQLLLLNSKVILPGFGAIVYTDHDTGELMFNKFLTYDDEKLASLVEQESNMDLQEAKNTVSKFIRELQATLDKGETYEIYQLGYFTKEIDSDYMFIGNVDYNRDSSLSAAVPETNLENILNKEKNEEEETGSNTHDEKKEEDDFVAIEDKKESILSTLPIVEEEESDTDEADTDEALAPEAIEELDEEYYPRKRIVLWPFLVALILILIGVFLISINYEKINNYMGWNKFEDIKEESTQYETTDKQQIEEDEVIHSDAETDIAPITDDSEVHLENNSKEAEDTDLPAIKETQSSKQAKRATESTITSTGNYHIVLGTFKEKINAEKLVEELTQKGLSAKILGFHNGMYYVSTQSYPSFAKAKQDLDSVLTISEGAWIFKL